MCSIKELTGRPRQAGQVESDLGVCEGQGPGGGGGGGGGRYSHILTIQVCAAIQGMLFKPFCQEQGIENKHFRSGTGW